MERVWKSEITDRRDSNFLWARWQVALHQQGVTIMMTERSAKSRMECKPVSAGLLTARFYSRLSVIQYYAPTNETSKDEKNDFHKQLQDLVDEVSWHDPLFFLVILIKGLGKTIKVLSVWWERKGLERGMRMATCWSSFVIQSNLVVGGSIFLHKDIHKTTWISPSEQSKSYWSCAYQ